MMSHVRTFLVLSSLLGVFFLAGCDGKSLEAPYDERTTGPGIDERTTGPGVDERTSGSGIDERTPGRGSSERASRPGAVLLSWRSPTERTDGSPLRNLAGYRVYFGKGANPARYILDITNPGQTSQFIDNLDRGRWYFSITAYDRQGLESAKSTPASKTIG